MHAAMMLDYLTSMYFYTKANSSSNDNQDANCRYNDPDYDTVSVAILMVWIGVSGIMV